MAVLWFGLFVEMLAIIMKNTRLRITVLLGCQMLCVRCVHLYSCVVVTTTVTQCSSMN